MKKKLIVNVNNRKIKNLCKEVYGFMGKKFNKLSDKMIIIDFISPTKIKKLKKEIWNMNVYTDTITLIFEDSVQIYLAEEIIRRNSLINGNTFEGELVLVLIHSLLHGLGKNEDEVIKIQDVLHKEFCENFNFVI